MDLQSIKIGEIVSIDDPTHSGRVKIRIKGVNDNDPIEKLPWATFAGSSVSSGSGGGAISIPRVGTKVRVSFKGNDLTSLEWRGPLRPDKKMLQEIAGDYEGTQVLCYDSESDLSVMFQPHSGLRIYYKESFIQITPDGNITLKYGGVSGTMIQLSSDRVDISGSKEINLTTNGTINLNAKNINVNGSDSVTIKGDDPGQCAVNGQELVSLLTTICNILDSKIPAGLSSNALLSGTKEKILNQNITYN